MGSTDTVYAHFNRRTGLEYSITTSRAEGSAGFDFDLYVRCNAVPVAPTGFDFGLANSGSDDHIIVPADFCPSPSTMYIAVNSHSGKGSLSLIVSGRHPSRVVDLHIGSQPGQFGVTNAELTAAGAAAGIAARHVFGLTEGTTRVANVFMYPYGVWGQSNMACGGNPCWGVVRGDSDNCRFPMDAGNLSLVKLSTRGRFPNPPAQSGCAFVTRTVAHEWGHAGYYTGALFGWLTDEYVVVNLPDGGTETHRKCGHSIMANSSRESNFCTVFNHNHGPDPADAGETWTDPAWQFIANKGLTPTQMGDTPDRYDYVNYDFDGLVGNVVIRWN